MNIRCQLLTNSKYNQTFHIVFHLFLFTLLFCGCQQETPQDTGTTNAEVYVRYLADEMKISAECTFWKKQDGTRTSKTFDNVTFANHPMQGRNISEQMNRYQINLERHILAPPYEIKFWNKGEEKPNSISLEIPKVDSFKISKKMKKGGVLEIFGTPLSEKEGITLMFTNEKNNSKEFSLGKISIEKPIIFNQQQLSTLPSGKNKLYLIRTKVENNNGSKKTLQYYSQSIDTEIVR